MWESGTVVIDNITFLYNAKVLFNGDNYGYVHIEKDDSIISFDDSSLDYDYYYDGQLED